MAMQRSGLIGRRGFTMVELLTVIAIIAILAGILFPVFATIRRNVHKSTCTSNLHSIQQALKLYRDDHQAYPEALYGFRTPNSQQEVTFLYPQYIKEKTVFRCPLAPFHSNIEQYVPAVHPQELAGGKDAVGFGTRYAQRQYPVWDSYDGQLEPPNSTTATYVVKYVRHWSGPRRGFGDNPRQLLYKTPPEDTVVTWCTYHRDWDRSGAQPAPKTGSIDLVLFLDGHVKNVPSNQMHPVIAADMTNHSYLVNRGD